MMRRTLTLAAVLAALTLPMHRAAAQSITSFGVAAGATFPSGDFSDYTKTGYHALVTLDVHAPLMPVGLRIDGMFNELDLESSLVSSKGKARVWAGTANVVLNTGGLGPYLIGGLGLYHTTFSADGFTGSDQTKFGLNGGVGIRIPLTGFSAFAEARYHRLLGTNDSDGSVALVPLTFGIVF